MSNRKLKPPLSKNQEVNNSKTLKLDNSKKEIPAQKLFDFIMNAARDMMMSELIPIKRENQDLKITQKLLLKRIMNLELDYKALGISISNLGVTELHLLNETMNRIKLKLSVVDSKGGIQGRVNTSRFNLVPSSDKLMVEVSNSIKEEEGNKQ